MAKYYGSIGYAAMVETSPGVHEEMITTRKYYGDLIRNTRRLQPTDQLNDNINVTNEISIVADPFAVQNFHTMRFAELYGVRWKISNVEVKPPRLVLSLGGLYNG